MKDRLRLADRGYPGVDYFEAVDDGGGAFIVRLTRSYDPWVRAAWIDRTSALVRSDPPLLARTDPYLNSGSRS
jgi:hypothetical protein